MQRTLRLLFVVTLVGSVLAASLGALPRAWAATPAGEPEIHTPGAVGDYLRRAHARVHARWAEGFLKAAPPVAAPRAGAEPATTGPLAVDGHPVVVALTIRWDGSIADALVKSSSGLPDVDRTVITAARKSGPFPLPTSDVLSDDGYAHLDWTFARDHLACSGVSLQRVEDPIEVSLPRLVNGNRIGEALRRVGAAGADSLDRFARLYLGRNLPDSVLDTAASVALATAGDKTQVARLRAALASRATVKLAAKGLRQLGVDVCDVVREPLEGSVPFVRDTAFEAVRAAAADGMKITACRPSLEGIVKDGKQAQATRLAALDLLVAHLGAEIRPLVMALMSDKDPGVRGAATLASVRKGAGRPEMYRLAPLLHDKTLEVRGAASAGMVRAAGDLALDQLYLLSHETDPRPARWVATELAALSSPASAEFLGHMLKRDNREVQLAATRALLARTDEAARALVAGLRANPEAPAELRALATGPAGSPSADRAVATPDLAQFQTLLHARRSHEALTWVVTHFSTLSPTEGVDVLGAWLVRDTLAAAAPPAAAPPADDASAAATATPSLPAGQEQKGEGAPTASAASALAL